MIRRIIQIDQVRCNGCGLCAQACHEGAIAMENGKAKLIRDDYCDGLGDCLPACPAGAITFVEREAAPYDQAAVLARQRGEGQGQQRVKPEGGCPGSRAQFHGRTESAGSAPGFPSQLRQWPVQIKLAPINAPYFNGAHLLIAADCTAYAYGDFHARFIRGKVTLIGCPKLDGVDYGEKLTQILEQNEIKSVTIVRMEVPCCGGLQRAAEAALKASGKLIPWHVVTISVDGRILEEE